MPFTYNADESFDLYVQVTSPGAYNESNWLLPTPPSGPFNLSTRIYQPKKELLDGTYKLPPVTRVPRPPLLQTFCHFANRSQILKTLTALSIASVVLTVGIFAATGAAAQAQAPAADAKPATPAAKPAKAAKPTAKAPAKAPEMVREPRALALLKGMSERLAAAKSMSFTSVVTYEHPSLLGPALAFTTRSEVLVQRPDKLRVLTLGDGPATEFYYDGKKMMAFAPAENFVAVADAPPTIEATLKTAYNSAAIYYPFTDLILTDPYAVIADGVTLAFYIGQSKVVGGTTTEMLAFATNDVFVQVWIGAEDKLPRKMNAVFRADPLRLRHQLDLSNWQLDPAVPADAFSSAKIASATPIAFARPEVPKLPPGFKPIGLGKSAKPKTQ